MEMHSHAFISAYRFFSQPFRIRRQNRSGGVAEAQRIRARFRRAVKDLIREFCEAYQKEMAAAGIFNSNIISRLLGLVDKQQQESRIENRIVVEDKDQADKIKTIGDIG